MNASETSKLPRIRLESLGLGLPPEVFDLEQARDHLFERGHLFSLDGHCFGSYEELFKLVCRDEYIHREILDIEIIPVVGGG